ncbi:hypothetical protein ACUSIJ_08535 [Pseudochelatococcus sp. B33]
MSESTAVSPSVVSYQPLPHEEAASDSDGACTVRDAGRVATVPGFDFLKRFREVFEAAGGMPSSASNGPESAGKRIYERAVLLLSHPKAPTAAPDGDPDAPKVETAARLAARLHSKVAVMKRNIDLLSNAEDMKFDDPEVVLKKKKNIRFAAVNYASICERLALAVDALEPAHTADDIRQALAMADKTNMQDVGEFHSHAATASNPASTAQNIVHLVVNKTVGVLPESVQESMKDAAIWIADQVRDNCVTRVAFKIIAALGMFLAYAVPIALVVASVIVPPIAPITATLAGGATLACPFVAHFCGELWKALRDKDTGPDTPDLTMRILPH